MMATRVAAKSSWHSPSPASRASEAAVAAALALSAASAASPAVTAAMAASGSDVTAGVYLVAARAYPWAGTA